MGQNDSPHREEGIEFLRETDKAIQIRTSEGEDIWLPISQVERMFRGKGAENSWIEMTGWIARQKGLIR